MTVPVDRLLSGIPASTEETLAVFDTLEPVSTAFMLGDWHGSGVPTGHPMDGLLENFNWRGKRFMSEEAVHPLIFQDAQGHERILDPRWMPMKYARQSAFARHPLTRAAFSRLMGLMSTSHSRARLRMLEYRGQVSATMVYDDLPIHDVFRRIDDDTVLGLMDLKGMKRPFFFVLKRSH